MVKSPRAQMFAVLAIGGLLGYMPASNRLDVFRPTVTNRAASRILRLVLRSSPPDANVVSNYKGYRRT